MKEERSQELAEKAVKLADLWIRKRLPWLGGALMVPVNEWLESDVSGTDGVRIFWNPDEVCRFFEESTAKLARRYLHLQMCIRDRSIAYHMRRWIAIEKQEGTSYNVNYSE